jgi:hypothetical protein
MATPERRRRSQWSASPLCGRSMTQPRNTASSTKAMNPPSSGQNMRGNIYEPGRRPSWHYACRATCSLADGNAQATCSRRSWRKTKRSWLGGRSPSGWAGRKVAQGLLSVTAQRRFWWKKQFSQLTFVAPARPFAMRNSAPFVFRSSTDDAPIKANFTPLAQSRFPENATNFSDREYLQRAGL